MNQQEIERKWLMAGFPDLPYEKEVLQTQSYLCFEPSTVRIRKTERAGQTGYVLTIKGRGTLTRTEVELPLQREQYEALVPLQIAPGATKRLRVYRLSGGQAVECSLVDEGEAGAFYYCEVEFASEEEARAFQPPAWFGREVTEEPGYTMAAYCRAKLDDGGNTAP